VKATSVILYVTVFKRKGIKSKRRRKTNKTGNGGKTLQTDVVICSERFSDNYYYFVSIKKKVIMPNNCNLFIIADYLIPSPPFLKFPFYFFI